MADVKQVLTVVRDGLAPLVEVILKAEADKTGENWIDIENTRRELKDLRLLRLRADGSLWDPMDLLQTIRGERWFLLRPIFVPKGTKLTAKEERTAHNLARGRIEEILNRRNDWAHFVEGEEIDHLIQTCTLLLRSAGLDEAAKLIEQPIRSQVSTSGSDLLVHRAVPSAAIRLIRQEFRGLDLDEPAAIERISPGEKVRLEIDLNKVEGKDLEYGLVVVVDPVEIICLLPSARIAPNRRLEGRMIRIPDRAVTQQALRFRGTLGRHIIVALLTREPLAESIYAHLATPQPRSFLDRIDVAIDAMGKGDWLLIKMEFEIG